VAIRFLNNHNQQPTTNHQQPTTNNQQPPTTNNQQPTTNKHQSTTNNQQQHQPTTKEPAVVDPGVHGTVGFHQRQSKGDGRYHGSSMLAEFSLGL
jgi:hypothetical protein